MSFGGGGGTNDQRHELSKVQLTPTMGRAARPPSSIPSKIPSDPICLGPPFFGGAHWGLEVLQIN